MPVIRIAFVWPDLGWMGGVNYFKSLFYALHTHANDQVEPVLFTGLHSDTYGLEAYAKLVRTPLLDVKSLTWTVSKAVKAVSGGREFLLRRLLHSHNINVISHYNWLWKGCGIPSTAWIPDFQVLHLPQCFPENERQSTLDFMRRNIEKSDAIILSSEDAKADLRKFCQGNLDVPVPNAYVLHFPSSFFGSLELLPSRNELREKYNLPDEPWFHVPNQFWQHKNHTVIAEASRLLYESGNAPLVLATGKEEDGRNPNYVPEFKKQLGELGLSERFRIMGQIPYMDMMGLMLHSIAVINPSKFEGWSTTVEEAKAFGKKVILSDIAVHREQKPDRALYFGVDDKEALASLLIDSISVYNEKEEAKLSREVFARKEEAMKAFAESYVALINNLDVMCEYSE